MGPERTLGGRVYQEIYRAALSVSNVSAPQQALADLRDTIAARCGAEPEEIELSWDGNELSCWIQMQAVGDITLHLTPEGLWEAGR